MTNIREKVLVEKLKVSLKSKLLDLNTYYLSDFKHSWGNRASDVAIGEAIRQLEAEGFLSARVGRKGAVILYCIGEMNPCQKF
jgi:hypothetical protein